ncbi:hypothetical protein JVT61DRAFT_12391 [Boletus reticuloceps]|uniref:E3 ubiquitin-protein ligase n=1 Tax=Boletus reticuloceps TaxID=495285 RepID=A0A8I3A448_9AGAM|nr:hypothetical protein JVT61DRAFT_12391 [Boletus reticuloceps]
MRVHPNRRAATIHIEYETDAWISVFNVPLSLSHVIKVYGEAFSWATPSQFMNAISIVVRDIPSVCTLENDKLDKNKSSKLAYHNVLFGDVECTIVEFDVWRARVRDLFMWIATEEAILTSIDFPLRDPIWTVGPQRLSNTWSNVALPRFYDQDLFILQTSLIILDPNTVIVSILDQFKLLQFFCGAVIHPTYESPQLSSMVEEVLHVVITLLTEKGSATSWTMLDTDSERMTDDICFEHVLRQVASFRAPEATTDTGTYELKDALHEEVEAVLKARVTKKAVVPKPIGMETGPFSILPSLLESVMLLQVMFYAIYNILVLTEAAGTTPSSAEAILDQAFYLVMIALVERASVFSHLSALKVFEDGKNLIDIVCAMEHTEHFKPYTARARRKVVTAMESGVDAETLKRRAAKARQEASMVQMKAQQASFAINFEEADDDEDEEMEESWYNMGHISYFRRTLATRSHGEHSVSSSLAVYFENMPIAIAPISTS